MRADGIKERWGAKGDIGAACLQQAWVRRFAYHTSPGVPVRREATSGDGGALDDDASRLQCSGCQHATCVLVSPRRRARKPAPAVGPRGLPLPEADVRLPPSGKRCVLQRRQGLTCGHCYREERLPRRIGIEFPTQKHTHRRYLREPPSGGSPACRKCWLRWISCFHF